MPPRGGHLVQMARSFCGDSWGPHSGSSVSILTGHVSHQALPSAAPPPPSNLPGRRKAQSFPAGPHPGRAHVSTPIANPGTGISPGGMSGRRPPPVESEAHREGKEHARGLSSKRTPALGGPSPGRILHPPPPPVFIPPRQPARARADQHPTLPGCPPGHWRPPGVS